MNDFSIVVEGISKVYNIDEYRTKRVKEWLEETLFKRRRKIKFHALNSISFSVIEGDILGIIGTNGSGKSTLLKILACITPPTSGNAKVWGKIACLIEVGTGFNRELNGLENIYLNGAILGMKRDEININLPDIIKFSEINPKLLQVPIKKYSSGMKIRLAFSIVTHLCADILLMDEILSVSDINFQKKGLAKLQELAKKGKTIIYVSHDLKSVQKICNRCIVLDQGTIQFTGKTSLAIKYYLSQNRFMVDKNTLTPDA